MQEVQAIAWCGDHLLRDERLGALCRKRTGDKGAAGSTEEPFTRLMTVAQQASRGAFHSVLGFQAAVKQTLQCCAKVDRDRLTSQTVLASVEDAVDTWCHSIAGALHA